MDYFIDLQLFAEEKTEKATPKKRRDARERGNIPQSKELNSALVLIGCFSMLYICATFILGNLKNHTARILSMGVEDGMFSVEGIKNLISISAAEYLKSLAPIAGSALFIGLLTSYLQVGFVFTTKTLEPKLGRLNPVEGLKRIFSRRSLAQLVKSLLKVSIIGCLMYKFLINRYEGLPMMLDMEVIELSKTIGFTMIQAGIYAGAILLVLAIMDYYYQRYEYEKSIMMTKHEIKEEYKQMEGNPQVKAKIKEKQRQISMRRMMADIPKADVVITNPTHFAVALKYDPDKAKAPYVLAKGKNLIALRIKELAKENDVYTVENPELARGLYDTTEIGDMIPPALYQAVAEVLAFVYSVNKNT